MRRLLFMLLLMAGIFPAGNAQENLVRNPSFEEYNYLPGYIGDAPGAISGWRFANESGSGDYYHTRARGEDYRTIDNYFGSEDPHTGEAYAGFCVTPGYREFLCSELKTKLVKGQQYRFTMYISKGDRKDVGFVKELGVMFLSRWWVLPTGLQMALPPQIVFYQDTGFTQQNGWQQLTAVYTARGNEQWMYIGAHEWKCDTCKSIPGMRRTQNPGIFGNRNEAHYFVDDVSLVEVNDTPVKAPAEFQPGITYAFSNIHFATNSALLQSVDQPDLQNILAYLLANPQVNVAVAGHTDSIGSDESNRGLSVARAEAVKNYFIGQGVSSARIRTEGYGETKPVQSNSTEEGRAQNRRVEFTFGTAPE